MMLAASIEGSILFLVIAAIVGAINWIANRAKTGKDAPPAQPRQSTFQPQAQASRESEDVRMRRFLDALGVPAGQQAPPRAAAAPPLPKPRPPIVARPIVRPAPRATRAGASARAAGSSRT